ncbi:MAG: hypothetical protein GXP19_07155 [Gammaproteobacteria bacterium]|nr:hypothetical protein [Gammaproteobacteria bacterium]
MSYVAASNFFDEPLPVNESLPSVVTVEYASNAVGSQDKYFYVDHGLQFGNRLQLGFGSTSYDAQIDDTVSYSFGFTGDPLNELNFGFSYNFLERDDIVIGLRMRKDTALASATWQQEDWLFSFKPQISNILLQARDANANRGIRSPGFELSASYFGLNGFSLSANHAKFSYSNNIEFLKAIALRTGQFDESRTSAAIDYNIDWGSVGLEWQRNVAIDNIDVYDVALVNVFLILSDNWFAQGRLGSPSGGSVNTEGFGSLALSYSW